MKRTPNDIAAEQRVLAKAQRIVRALGIIEDMVDEANDGDASRMIAAAESETTIARLAEQLRIAINLIPLDRSAPEILRMEAALAAAVGSR